MTIDFDSIGSIKEQPTLVLENLDGSPLQTLGYAYNRQAEILYNAVSSITFVVPAYVDGVKTPHYDDIVGMRIIDMRGWGRFVLINPSTSNDGIKEVKECKAYSIEYELTFKKVYFEEATYNFWDPTSPDDTILGIILSYLPSWSVGHVDETLIGKYRTISETNENAYNFIKSTLQDSFQCIFDFNTYTKEINVIDAVSSDPVTKPVYLSFDNLVKEITQEEDTESIVTVLDVNGGEGVDIRMVNPLGTNKIYNLDYFMNESYFSQEMIDKWRSWESTYNTNQQLFYNTSVEYSLKLSQIATENAILTEMTENELGTLLNERSTYVEYLAGLTNRNSQEYINTQARLDDVNARISAEESRILEQQGVIDDLQEELEEIYEALVEIRDDTQFSEFFTDEEMSILEKYFKEDSIEESSFIVSEVASYTGQDISNEITTNTGFVFSGASVSKTTGSGGQDLYTVSGGHLSCTGTNVQITANVVSAAVEREQPVGTYPTAKFVMSIYLGSGSINGTSFPSGTISATGECSLVSDVSAPAGEQILTGTSIDLETDDARFYFTRNTTDYERYAVEWDLYDYGTECLKSLAYPSYTFNVSSATFFSAEEFAFFVDNVSIGNKIYLNNNGDVLQPICIGFNIDFEDISSLTITLSDKYSSSDNAFKLVDLLEQGISMGKTLDSNKMNYSSFVRSGASGVMHEFINSALDVAKNNILSSSGQGVSWDDSGLHLRKFREGSTSEYEDEQIWAINNAIVFTDDGWQTAKMAIGKVIDENIARYSDTTDTTYNPNKTYYYKNDSGEYVEWTGGQEGWATRPTLYEKSSSAYGIVAPYIVGTLLAGENLAIDTDNGSFRVDSSGVYVNSLKFNITHDGTTYDTLDTELGGISDLSERLASVIDDDDNLIADKIAGTINAVNSKMQNSTGNVLFDDTGIWLLNGNGKSNSTQAVWMNENGILFGSGNRTDRPEDEGSGWTWTTAIGHNGITAEALTGKTITGSTINGGSISIGGTLGQPNFSVDSEGNLIANKGTFRGDLDAPTMKGVMKASLGGAWIIGTGISVGPNVNEASPAETGKFVVDSEGNVKMSGNINMSNGTIFWGSNSPVKAQYSSDGVSWHDTFDSSSDYYARYSYDGGTTWTDSARIQSTDASVTFQNVNAALGNMFKDRNGLPVTEITGSCIYAPVIEGGSIYSSKIYAGEGEGYTRMTGTGLDIKDRNEISRIGLGYKMAGEYSYPYVSIGAGSGVSGGADAGIVMKFANGVWVGSADVMDMTGTEPSTSTGATTGIFIDIYNGVVYKYINGTRTEIGSGSGGGGGGGTAVAVFG